MTTIQIHRDRIKNLLAELKAIKVNPHPRPVDLQGYSSEFIIIDEPIPEEYFADDPYREVAEDNCEALKQ